MRKLIPLLTLLIFIPLLISSYNFFSSKLVISFYDEEQWIGMSAFLQPYLERNFSTKVWDTYYTIDEPTLMYFTYGLWLYPKYLKEKTINNNLDYNKYLILHGFYHLRHIDEYRNFQDSLGNQFVTLKVADFGFPEELVGRYGKGILKNIEIIQYSRILNTLFLTFTVTLLFQFIRKNKGYFTALIFSFFYAFNYLILTVCLPANADALFLFLFNLSLITLFKYLESQKLKYLILFSVFTGLLFSTKLNGLMIYFLYVILAIIFWFSTKDDNKTFFIKLFKIFLPLPILIPVFIILNPYTYPSPLLNLQAMFFHRVEAAAYQSIMFPDVALSTLGQRIVFITETFLNNHLFIEFNMTPIYKAITILMFMVGILYEIKQIFQSNKFSKFMFISFVVIFLITLSYIQLAWTRYLIQLTLFVIYYQSIGIITSLNLIKKGLSKLIILTKPSLLNR